MPDNCCCSDSRLALSTTLADARIEIANVLGHRMPLAQKDSAGFIDAGLNRVGVDEPL